MAKQWKPIRTKLDGTLEYGWVDDGKTEEPAAEASSYVPDEDSIRTNVETYFEDVFQRPATEQDITDWTNQYIEDSKKVGRDVTPKEIRDGFDASAEQLLVGDYATEQEAPGYEYELTPEMQTIVDSVNDLATKVPEFTPDMVTKWKPLMDEIYAPYLEEAKTSLKEEYNALSPYSFGSGKQMTAMNKLLSDVTANKASQALALGQAEYQKNFALYTNAVNQSMDISDARQAGKKMESDDERDDYWKNMQRTWAVADTATDQAFAREVADLYQPPDRQWWQDLVQPLATGAGYLLAGPAGGAIGSQFGKNVADNYRG